MLSAVSPPPPRAAWENPEPPGSPRTRKGDLSPFPPRSPAQQGGWFLSQPSSQALSPLRAPASPCPGPPGSLDGHQLEGGPAPCPLGPQAPCVRRAGHRPPIFEESQVRHTVAQEGRKQQGLAPGEAAEGTGPGGGGVGHRHYARLQVPLGGLTTSENPQQSWPSSAPPLATRLALPQPACCTFPPPLSTPASIKGHQHHCVSIHGHRISPTRHLRSHAHE